MTDASQPLGPTGRVPAGTPAETTAGDRAQAAPYLTVAAAPLGKRAQRRREIEASILRVAREHVATEGAAALSLRAVARDLGMVSSGIYRYVESRDDLLTRLIVDAYTSLADAVLAAHDAVPIEDLDARWRTIGSTIRAWALSHPHDYALIYGTPVPGYAAPAERTNMPGSRVMALLVHLLDDARRVGRLRVGAPDPLAEAAAAPLLDDPFLAGSELTPEQLTRAIAAWTLLIGAVSSELFGHLGPVPDPGALFDSILETARMLVLP
jgi:AcrR family transcriptional regulator